MSAQIREEFTKYRCWVFDCDGVLLDSNAAKTQAFHDVAMQFGPQVADQLTAYHKTHGGISRFVKFQYLFTTILGRDPKPDEMQTVLTQFADAAKTRLLACPQAPRLTEVLQAVAKTGPVYVVSGGLQDELRDVFAQRGLEGYFTAIFGSPDTKDDILARERASGAMPDPALFIGDARYDFEAADRYGLDFLFVSNWSEFSDWPNYFHDRNVTVFKSIQDLLMS